MSVSNATAADAERLWGLAPDRVRVVAPGVDPVFGPADRVAARERVARDLGVHAPFVLAVGSLEPRKGLDVLIEAAALARARGDGWQLVLAGRAGHGGHGLVVRATAAGALVTGGVDEASLLNLYRAADVVAVPSLYEGFGLTPLEAMACGTPAVIAGGSGGLEEVSGAAAVVVERREAEAWRDALARARADRERLAEAGVAHAAQFTWTRAADRTADVLLEAAAA
jgi:glycosyltransferase involved in cell wall biosynthesis